MPIVMDGGTAALPTTSAPVTFASGGPDDDLVVVVSASRIIIDNGATTIDLPSGAEQSRTGVRALIAPLVTSARSKHDKDRAEGHRSSAVLIAEPSTPYRTLFDVVDTLRSSGIPAIHFMVLQRAAKDAAVASSSPPRTHDASSVAPLGKPGGVPLSLHVAVTTQGMIVSTFGGALGTGCEPTTTGVTVPKFRGAQDMVALEWCAARIKAGAPDEESVSIRAEPAIDYRTIIAVMDALRGSDPGHPLFRDVALETAIP